MNSYFKTNKKKKPQEMFTCQNDAAKNLFLE